MTDSSGFNHRDALGKPVEKDAIIAKIRQHGFTQSHIDYIEATGKLMADVMARRQDKDINLLFVQMSAVTSNDYCAWPRASRWDRLVNMLRNLMRMAGL
ncbi:hypothetical protein LCGC14_1744000 [marine sediment metagenome]|uniref:Uncharacterized protein n=1 Tax=marine sediment metagenome TaxID=412755 RepID=A0A0F9JL43_9ZZZZ